ncbi:uncharacterized protein LOC144742579 [Ciona intestinalis]
MESTKRLFDHQPAINAEVKFIVNEFEKLPAKNLRLLGEMERKSKHHAEESLPSAINVMKNNLVKLQTQVQTSFQMSERILALEQGQTPQAEMEKDTSSFWKLFEHQKEEIITEHEEEKRMLEEEYRNLSEQIERENSIS